MITSPDRPLEFPAPDTLQRIEKFIQNNESPLNEFVCAQADPKTKKLQLFFQSKEDPEPLKPIRLEQIPPDASAEDEAAMVNKKIDQGCAPLTHFFDVNLKGGEISFMAYRKDTPLPALPEPDGDGWITTTATIFGLNYNGSIDEQDNGIGSPYLGSIKTANKNVIGCAIPMRLVLKQFGTYAGAKNKFIEVVKLANDLSTKAKIVDLGPAEGPVSKGHALDLTYGAHQAIGSKNDCRVKYRFLT